MSLIITLIVIGLILLAIEVLIIPGFGVAGILGLLSLAGAAVLGFTMFSTTTGLIILAVIIFCNSNLHMADSEVKHMEKSYS